MKKKYSTQKGFSLPEVLIATLVLTIGIIGAVQLMTRNIRSAFDSRDAVIAAQLAQEGVELTRNVRDNNIVRMLTDESAEPFDSFSGGNCSVAISNRTVELECPSSATQFSVNGAESRFQRRIVVEDFVRGDADSEFSDAQARVRSEVTWRRNDFPEKCTTGNRCVSAEIFLTSWFDL